MDCFVDFGDGDEMDFECQTHPVARKQHICVECREAIAIGQRYERFTYKFDGIITTVKTCESCCDLRQELTDKVGAFPILGSLGCAFKEYLHANQDGEAPGVEGADPGLRDPRQLKLLRAAGAEGDVERRGQETGPS